MLAILFVNRLMLIDPRSKDENSGIDRNKDTANTVFENGDLRLDVKYKMLKGNNGYMQLSQRETELLAHPIRSDGVVISKDVLKRELWGSVKVTDNALDRKIFEVRKAVKTVSTEMVLQSVYGRGIFLRSRTYSEDRGFFGTILIALNNSK